ncbi:MAG: hypothetical protein H0X64_13365 [Gemmatimonadaceae bacterium]|nr:hypothetical protein [Gemmatimonadaceae bacterium]
MRLYTSSPFDARGWAAVLAIAIAFTASISGGMLGAQAQPVTARDTAYLDSLLRQHRHPLALENGRLTGPGARLLLEAAAGAQFFMVGESHNVAEIPRFTAALFDTLHAVHGYDYFATEYGPEVMRMLSAPGVRGRLAATLDLGRRYPHAFHFWNDEELEAIAQVGARSRARGHVLWGLDQEWGALHLLERLAVLARDDAARTHARRLADSARKVEAARPFELVPVPRWIDGADSTEIARLRAAFAPVAGSEADRLLDALERSNRFYRYNRLGEREDPSWYFRSNKEREEYMKEQFSRAYRGAQQAGDSLPKVVLKFGNVHGGNWVNHLEVHTLGNFLNGVATLNGLTSFHLVAWLVNDPGTYWSLTEEAPYVPVARMGSPNEWVVVDLRPVRWQLYSGRLRAMSRELRAVVLGFDAVLLIGNGTRGTYDALRSPGAAGADPESGGDPFAVMTGFHRMAAQELWPGFDARGTPVAIHDGVRTLLFGHPAPPPGFSAVPGRPGVHEFEGRHPAVTANSSAELGGVATATALMHGDSASVANRAALLVHEAFHVFQRARHPSWTANEVELFTYPVADDTLLALRQLEDEALRRALAAAGDARTSGSRIAGAARTSGSRTLNAGMSQARACWARAALDLRQRRLARLTPGAAQYERGTELNEGLATYVELRAAGVGDAALFPQRAFAPDAVRARAYRTGAAIGRLLDHHDTGWRARLEARDSVPLDQLLSATLAARAADRPACTFTAAEHDRARADAVAAVAALAAERAARRAQFLAQPGFTLRIIASGAPLFPQGFDPLNVHALAPGEVLHTRFLSLGGSGATLEVLGHAALTRAAGAHPLFNGVREVVITGLKFDPVPARTDSSLVVTHEGLRGEFVGGTVERNGDVVTVRVGGS